MIAFQEHTEEPSDPVAQIAREQLEKIEAFHDRALKFYLDKIDQLIVKLNEHRAQLTARTELVKQATREHFGYVDEVIALTSQANRILEEKVNGATQENVNTPGGAVETSGYADPVVTEPG